MKLSRRKTLALGSGVVALASASAFPVFADATEDAIAALTGGADVIPGAVSLSAPAIAEDGNIVAIRVDAPGAVEIALFADDNPLPNVARFRFGPLSASRSVSTRIRLARSQNVIAVARLEDGTFRMARAAVQVTVGGCGA